jgi:hypothetical protein
MVPGIFELDMSGKAGPEQRPLSNTIQMQQVA